MLNTGVWDDACRARLREFLTNSKAVDALTLLFYGESSAVGRDTVSEIIGLDEYLGSVEQRLAGGDMHESARVALEKAKDLPF